MRISLRSVTKSYGPTRSLDDVSIDVETGEIVAVLGMNGAGKTTLLRCLLGLVAPDAGEIRYDGERFHRERLDLRRRMFLLPDFPLVYPNMSVLRHIDLVLRLYEADRSAVDERVIRLLRELDMLPNIDAALGTLSRGQAYKAALTALMAVDPELWMFDEPFASGMDPAGLHTFRTQVRDALRRGRTVLYTTQLLGLAEFADRVCVLHRGRVHAFDRIERLKAQQAGGATEALERLFVQLRGEPT
ncbi:MAG TPA: ABC transporter ATP-binding protein [Pirellulales bacterium]|nr:ABC transporter ATP-binding protein [Pirellulales bacterium]